MNKDKDEIALLTEIIDKQNREIRSLRTIVKLQDARIGQIEETIKNFNENINVLSSNDQSLNWNLSRAVNDLRVDLYKKTNELTNAISPGQGPKKIVRVCSRPKF